MNQVKLDVVNQEMERLNTDILGISELKWTVQFNLSLSRVPPSVTPWTATCQVSLSITNSQSLLKLMSIEMVMQPFHPLLSPSPPAPNPSQHQGLFK